MTLQPNETLGVLVQVKKLDAVIAELEKQLAALKEARDAIMKDVTD